VGYIRLKHALADVALAAVEDPASAPTVVALAAYARLAARSGPAGGRPVPIAELARAAGVLPDEVRDRLASTRLFSAGDPSGLALDARYAPHAGYFTRQVTRAAGAVRILALRPAPRGAPRAVWRAAVLFNAGLFFECHEYLEDSWRSAGPEDRAFYHGLIQAAAACYHWENGNAHGARVLAGKALAKLRAYAPARHGVAVAQLLADLAAVRDAAGADPPRPPRGRGDLPVIAWSSPADGRTRP